MPNWEDKNLESCFEDAFGTMRRELAREIRPIIQINMSRGRVRRFLKEGMHQPGDYVWRVAEIYERTNAYVREVQVERSEVVWQPLYGKLKRWACSLQRKGYHNSWRNVTMTAAECAADAGAQIVSSHFPYDTEFDAWAYMLLRYTWLKQLNQGKQLKRVPEEKLVELDVMLPWLNVPVGMSDVQRSNWRFDLLRGIEQLATEARREVVMLRYFENMTYEEIAKRMGRTIGAVYKLHFEAIEELKIFLGEDNT